MNLILRLAIIIIKACRNFVNAVVRGLRLYPQSVTKNGGILKDSQEGLYAGMPLGGSDTLKKLERNSERMAKPLSLKKDMKRIRKLSISFNHFRMGRGIGIGKGESLLKSVKFEDVKNIEIGEQGSFKKTITPVRYVGKGEGILKQIIL